MGGNSVPIVELPLTEQTQTTVGFIGLLVAGSVFLGALYRLVRFIQACQCRLVEIIRTPFGRKRLAIHLLVLGGTVFAIALYTLLIAQREVCIGLVALQRFQFLCVFSSLGLILSDWRIDVWEQPLLSGRLTLYGLRDIVTSLLLAAGFVLNCTGPFFCLGSDWAWEYGFSAGPGEGQSMVINATYILQVLCALVLMASMLYSGLQMKKRLLWASRSPLRENDLFRVALQQLNAILFICTASFVSQVLALLFNYVQLVGFDGRMLVWSPLVWCLAVWLPSVGWSASCLYLARKPRRQSFGGEGRAATPGLRYGQDGGEYVQVLLSSHDGEEEDGGGRPSWLSPEGPSPLAGARAGGAAGSASGDGSGERQGGGATD